MIDSQMLMTDTKKLRYILAAILAKHFPAGITVTGEMLAEMGDDDEIHCAHNFENDSIRVTLSSSDGTLRANGGAVIDGEVGDAARALAAPLRRLGHD